jgi:Arc/MetJ family transcription regulator
MRIYSKAMKRRTTIVVDDALLERAQEVLGTSGLKDTVDTALREVIDSARRRRLARLLRTGEAFDFHSAPVDRASQWRTPSS